MNETVELWAGELDGRRVEVPSGVPWSEVPVSGSTLLYHRTDRRTEDGLALFELAGELVEEMGE